MGALGAGWQAYGSAIPAAQTWRVCRSAGAMPTGSWPRSTHCRPGKRKQGPIRVVDGLEELVASDAGLRPVFQAVRERWALQAGRVSSHSSVAGLMTWAASVKRIDVLRAPR